jgi:hypothetical protein
MTNATIKGIVEQQAQAFSECPDYTTLGLRTAAGECIEVFLPTNLANRHPERFRSGQFLRLAGGEWQTDPATVETEAHHRYWPVVVEYTQ